MPRLLQFLKSPHFVASLITAAFIYFAFTFYEVRALNESARSENAIHSLVEWIDLKTMDARFRIRGPQEPQAPLALLTIDDRSIEALGRWPWSREKISQIIDRLMGLGAKAVGFDIVFSEPEMDSNKATLERLESLAGNSIPESLKLVLKNEKERISPDGLLAKSFEKFSNRVVLGSFNEESQSQFKAFQDYCRNSAFQRANAEKFVKITNLSFVVDDVADPFVDLKFDQVLDQIFSHLESVTTQSTLQERFKKTNPDQLSFSQANQLKSLVQDSNLAYCERWLEKNDEYLEASAKAYLGIFEKSDLLKNLALPEALEKLKSSVLAHPVVQHTRWTINTDELQEPSTYTASFNAEQDSDGSIRRASLFFRTGNKTGLSFVPSLSLETYLVANQFRADIEINKDPKNSKQKKMTKFQIKNPNHDPEETIGDVPVDEQGRMRINYAGGTNMYPYLPAKELFNESPEAEISQSKYDPKTKTWAPTTFKVNKADFIKDRIFIFGATAIGVYDLRVTPFEKNYPGPETHLNALGNLYDRNFIRTFPQEEKFMLISLLVIGLGVGFAVSSTGAVVGFALSLLGSLGLFALDQYLFRKNYITTMALPMILVLSLYMILTFYKYLTEERKKKYLRSTFSKYVSPSIVDEILKDPENVNLGGRKQRMTVFFSDVRGFTTISEKLDPQVLSDVLNRYLTPMTNIVFANKGTLDKYMGDALMAFFGAPIEYPEHAASACRSALQSLEKLKEIQIEFEKESLPRIDIGIGINTAEMSVGNMGSEIVRNYTVMGDAVNLGSRLEAINKEYGTRIVISEFTHKEVEKIFTCREIDRVRVKGKNEPVRIFELICEGPPPDQRKQNLDHFTAGYRLYHEKNFTSSQAEFKKALELMPEDPVSALYIERCDEFLTTPPPENWDGVFVMKTK